MSTPRLPRLLVLSALVALAQLAGCALDTLDLVPFGCAADLTCPAGTACLPSASADGGSSCVVPQAEVLCKADPDCAAVSSPTAVAVCDQGRCRLPCANGTGCGSTEVCSAAQGGGVCLQGCPACTCGAGLQCSALVPDGPPVCLEQGQGPGAACAAGAGCASGYVCSDGKGPGVCLKACTTPNSCATGVCSSLWYKSVKACLAAGSGLETPCTSEGKECGPKGSGAVCRGGSCLAACSGGDSSDCPTGELCSAATGGGVCAVDCMVHPVCPADFVCSGPFGDSKRRCVPKPLALGSTCSAADGASCSVPGPGATCQGTICAAGTCTDGAGCAPESFCSTSTGPGACLVDCTAGASCPGGLTCQSWFDGVHKACLSPNPGLGGLCFSEGQSCGAPDPRGVCKGKRCLTSCDGGLAPNCPGGSRCSSTSGPGFCLASCTTPGTCPGDLVCTGPDSGGLRACTPPASGLGDPCSGTGACGLPGQGASCVQGLCALPCAAGVGCPTGSVCSSSTSSGVCQEDCSASGSTCAANLVCKRSFDGARSVCTPAALALDSSCKVEGAACGVPGAGGVCSAGACVPACQGGSCAFIAGRVCSHSVGAGGGGCLTDCTTNANVCSAPLQCVNLGHDGKSGCGLACASAATTSACNLCGNAEAFNVDCGGGVLSADNSVCAGAGQFQCKPGYDPVDCTGAACTPATCVKPNWWCRPRSPSS